MKLYAGFILTDGRIKVNEVTTRNFRNMDIPLHSIGGMVINPKEMIKPMALAFGNVEFPPITYFGKRIEGKGDMVRTRAGTLIELPQDAMLIDV